MTNLLPFKVCARLLLASVAVPPLFTESVEVNTVRDEQGDVRLRQVVYWDYHDSSLPAVRDWHMADKCMSIVHTGKPDYPYTILRMRDCGSMQVIRTKRVTVTDTTFDVEEVNREILPVESRRGWR